MKYDVTFTEQAENDLRGIFEYIAFDLLSPENAAGQLDRIEEKILSLGEYPEKFRQYEREPWKSRNTRVVPVDNYVIFYIPDKTKKLVTVIRVMYSGRDVDKIEKTGFTPVFDEDAPYFKEAKLVLVCRKIYAQYLAPELFLDPTIKQNYPLKDYHKMYVGEIEKVLIKE